MLKTHHLMLIEMKHDDTNRDHFNSQGCGLNLRHNANTDHKRQFIQKQNMDNVIAKTKTTDNNEKSHRYRHMPKLLSCLIYSAILMMMVIIIVSVILFHINRRDLLSHSSHLNNYANFLRANYKSIINSKWPPLSSELYIPLAAVEMEGVSLKDADEFTKFTLNYSPEQILKRKRQIILDDLLKPTQHSDGLKFVLVEGAPGIGKSTLAKEICQRWATNPTAHKHLKQFSLVILVQLRDIQHATTLYDLLPKDTNTNMKEVEQELNKTYGYNVLWILDGFDELPNYQRQEGSLYRRFIKGDILKLSTVLVTSRPTASGALVQIVEYDKGRAKRVEIVGFNSLRIEEYAKEYFKEKPDRLSSFINYYNSTPIIERLMYIPLNAAIVCRVYDESYTRQLQFPKTMTELYDAITRALILRHLLDTKQVAEDFRMPSKLMCEEDLNHLPETAQEEFWKLSKLAYDGVRVQQYIFNYTMMTDIKDNLGLMNDISGFSVSSGTQYSSSFLHTTLQEYLAALYIANKPKKLAEQTFLPVIKPSLKNWEIFLDRNVTERMHLNQYSKNLEVVLVFYVGIKEKLQTELDDYIFNALYSKFHYSTLFARCIYESPQLSTKYQNRHLLIPSTYMEPLDYYIVGYLISHYNISLDVEIASGDSYGFIAKALPSPLKKHHGKLTLKIFDDSDKLFQLPKVIVKGLHFYSNIDNSYIIQTTKSFPNLQHITFPVISCNEICVHLQTLNYLKDLDILLKGTYEEFSSLIPLIKPGRPIKRLKLTFLFDVCPPLHLLFYPSSLETLELRCSLAFTNKCEFDLNMHVISQNTNLKELTIDNSCPDIFFINSIQLLKLKFFIFDNIGYQNIFLRDICIQLFSYKNLKEIGMFNETSEELSSIEPLIQPGRPPRSLQLRMTSTYRRCSPIYILFYPSSLERLQLFCNFWSNVTCKASFNKSLISQNTNVKELEISASCPYWDTILLSLATANTSKLRSLVIYHHDKKSLVTNIVNSKLHHHLINFHYLEELAIAINGTDEEISSIVQLIQPGRSLRHLSLTLLSYCECPPIHVLLYPSSLEKLEIRSYLINIDINANCELNFNKSLISQNINLKELVITTGSPCIETFSSLPITTKISIC